MCLPSSKNTANQWLAAGLLACSLLLSSGCATRYGVDHFPTLPPQHELSNIPFYPQQQYQCGPAALATALSWSGQTTSPETLTPQIYLPARQGSLQTELISATRRHQRIPYVIEPNLNQLLNELAAGNPVVVLQNLGLNWKPQWHYAVAIGYDLTANAIILRSGTTQRQLTPIGLFDRTWARSNRWGLLVLPPSRLPMNANETRYLQSVASLERLGHLQTAMAAYQHAAEAWPASPLALFALGNGHYRQGDTKAAEQAWRDAISRDQHHAPSLNNLAVLLLEQQRYEEALNYAERAVRSAPDNQNYLTTREEIRHAMQ